MGECVERIGRASPQPSLHRTHRSIAMPSLIMDVVAEGGVSADIGGRENVWVVSAHDLRLDAVKHPSGSPLMASSAR